MKSTLITNIFLRGAFMPVYIMKFRPDQSGAQTTAIHKTMFLVRLKKRNYF